MFRRACIGECNQGLNRRGETLVFNVSGTKYSLSKHVLGLIPESLLGSPRLRDEHFDQSRGEFFLDRHRKTFEAVIDYYFTSVTDSGSLLRPTDVALDIFIEELKHYRLPRYVGSCCRFSILIFWKIKYMLDNMHYNEDNMERSITEYLQNLRSFMVIVLAT